MGLLDIWNDWRKETGYFKDSSSNLQTMAQDSDTINRNKINRGRNIGISSNPMDNAINQSGHTPINRQNVDKIYPDRSQIWKNPKLSNQKLQELKKVQNLDASKTPNLYKDNIMQGGVGIKQGEDPSWWQGLANKFNSKFNIDEAMAHWKDKGGFEGLMANPAFTMGLAFMQAGAEGKTLGQGSLDNVMKAAGISSHYKKIIEDRKLEPIQATGSDIAEVKDMLKSINIEEGNWFENLLGGKKSGARYEAAVEEIAIQFQAEIRKKQKQLKADGKSQVIRRTDQLKILENLVKSGKIQKKESWLSRLGITSGTLQDTSGTKGFARGGPVRANNAYVVGEEGPEIMIAKSSGKVLSNDDSQIFAMLLAANPQLQKVSKARAEKIMRSRFPEYFE